MCVTKTSQHSAVQIPCSYNVLDRLFMNLKLVIMTKIEITIQERDGRLKATWTEQTGDPLPAKLWENIIVAIANAVEKGE